MENVRTVMTCERFPTCGQLNIYAVKWSLRKISVILAVVLVKRNERMCRNILQFFGRNSRMLNREIDLHNVLIWLWEKMFCLFTQLPTDKTLFATYRSVLHLLANEWAHFYIIILKDNVDSIVLLYPFNSFYVVQHPVFGIETCGRAVRSSNHLL